MPKLKPNEQTKQNMLVTTGDAMQFFVQYETHCTSQTLEQIR